MGIELGNHELKEGYGGGYSTTTYGAQGAADGGGFIGGSQGGSQSGAGKVGGLSSLSICPHFIRFRIVQHEDSLYSRNISEKHVSTYYYAMKMGLMNVIFTSSFPSHLMIRSKTTGLRGGHVDGMARLPQHPNIRERMVKTP